MIDIIKHTIYLIIIIVPCLLYVGYKMELFDNKYDEIIEDEK